jgi:hypothetical protein
MRGEKKAMKRAGACEGCFRHCGMWLLEHCIAAKRSFTLYTKPGLAIAVFIVDGRCVQYLETRTASKQFCAAPSRRYPSLATAVPLYGR